MLTSDLNTFLQTVRIETKYNSKIGVGTGFFLKFRVFGGGGNYIVTTKHLVKNMDSIFLYFLKSDEKRIPILGKTIKYRIPNHEKKFIFHDSYDLAILPFEPILKDLKEKGETIAYSSIRNLDFYLPPRYRGIEDVYFIGYPDGLWDTANYLPILRKGLTATILGINFGGQERFLIDANTIPGSSGSPVFIQSNEYSYDEEEGEISNIKWLRFVGILDLGLEQRPKIGTVEIPIPLSISNDDPKRRINIGGVIKARVLQDFIIDYLKKSGKWEEPFV